MAAQAKRTLCIASRAPFVGGAEVAAERLALGLQAEGHQVSFILGQHGPVQERFEQAGLRCRVVPMALTDRWRPWRYVMAQRQLRRILREERPDLLHSNDLPTHQMVSAAAARLGILRVCHHRFPFDGPTIDWFNKHGAEHHLFVSQALMDEMCAVSAQLRASSRTVLYDGLPLPPVPTDINKQQARSELDLPPDGVIVLFAGQIIERKGIAELIRAWALLGIEKSHRAHLIIAGEDLGGKGTYREQMEALALDLQVPARFVGFQKNIPLWLTASDIACVPSHVEPLGNATLEAMAHALPVLGCRVGGIPEMVLDGETGLLVTPRAAVELAEALVRMIDDEALRRRLGHAARRRCEERFSLAAHTQAALVEYARVAMHGNTQD